MIMMSAPLMRDYKRDEEANNKKGWLKNTGKTLGKRDRCNERGIYTQRGRECE